jgi:hypothetical protein
MAQRPSVDREPRQRSVAVRRADGRRRWHAWADRRRNGRAAALIEYDGAVLARLILAGWLPRSDTHRSDEIGRAVTDLIARGDLPRKTT